MTSGPIRSLLMGTQATDGVLPTGMQNVLFVGEPTFSDEFANQLIPVHNSTIEGDTLQAQSFRRTSINVKVPIFGDQTGWWFNLISGLPTDTAASGSKTITAVATGAGSQVVTSTAHGFIDGDLVTIAGDNSTPTINGTWVVSAAAANTFTVTTGITTTVAGTTGTANTLAKHVWKRALASAPPFGAFQFFNGMRWRQMLNTVVMSAKFNQDNATAPMMDVQLSGRAATPISAPTIPAVDVAYNPFGWRNLEVDVAGAVADATKFSVDWLNDRSPRYTGRPTADPKRYTRGIAKTAVEMSADVEAHSGSLKELYDNGGQIANFLARYQDLSVTLPPSLTLLAPAIRLATGDEPVEQNEPLTHVTGNTSYSSALATGMTMTLRNARAAGYYAAS
jgi:hypothetical protein